MMPMLVGCFQKIVPHNVSNFLRLLGQFEIPMKFLQHTGGHKYEIMKHARAHVPVIAHTRCDQSEWMSRREDYSYRDNRGTVHYLQEHMV